MTRNQKNYVVSYDNKTNINGGKKTSLAIKKYTDQQDQKYDLKQESPTHFYLQTHLKITKQQTTFVQVTLPQNFRCSILLMIIKTIILTLKKKKNKITTEVYIILQNKLSIKEFKIKQQKLVCGLIVNGIIHN